MAISSMSEYVLAPFLMLNALLKELLSYRDKRCRFNRSKLNELKHSVNPLIFKQGVQICFLKV